MSVADILGIAGPLAASILLAVWHLGSRITTLCLEIRVVNDKLSAFEREIAMAREGRTKIHEKVTSLSERVTIQETKNKSTMIGANPLK